MEGIEQEMNVIHQQTIIHGRYIQLYDAMSLSSIEINAAGNISGSMPKLDGCMLLFKDLMDLFNKAYIRQHSFLAKLHDEIEGVTSNADTVLSPMFLTKGTLDVETAPVEKLIDIDEVVEETNVTSPLANSSVDIDDVIKIQKSLVKSTLRQIYIALTSFMDVKLALLQCTQEIVNCYDTAIKSLAEQNGVLHAGIKYHIVVQPFMDSLLGHKLFNTVEVS
ncbi:hypothetical protein EON65_05455 [archaeon]|nr:MAG: hypothetical protein EON65_05455 [archaeon]